MESGRARFKRENFFPGEYWVNDMLEQFLSLFHRYDYIYKPLNKPDAQWYSLRKEHSHWKLQDSEILKAISGTHPRYIFGARTGKTSYFAILDIDKGSKYHNKKELKKLLRLLARASIKKSSFYRSSESGGWHLYIFFDQPMPSIELKRYFTDFLKVNGYVIRSGQLEVFPQPSTGKSLGNGVRLPLQRGFAWLNKKTLDAVFERDQMSAMQALDHFIADMKEGNSFYDFKKFKESISQLLERKTKISREAPEGIKSIFTECTNNSKSTDNGSKAKEVKEVFGALPPGINTDNWIKGRSYYQKGLTGPSQRADAIFSLSHYLFYGDPEIDLPPLAYGLEQEREWAIKEILETKHNGLSKDINNDRPDALAQTERCANWLPAHKRGQELEPYKPSMPIAYIKANLKRKTDARKRIKEALDQLIERGTYFSTNDLKKLASCSTDTLYKNGDIWKEAQEKAKDGILATSPGEINVGKGSDSSKINSPVPSKNKIEPLGLRACRQILSEIKMRSDREAKSKLKEKKVQISKQEKLWTDSCKQLIPKSLNSIPTNKLKAKIAVLNSRLFFAPDYDSESWLRQELVILKGELESRLLGPQQLFLTPE